MVLIFREGKGNYTHTYIHTYITPILTCYHDHDHCLHTTYIDSTLLRSWAAAPVHLCDSLLVPKTPHFSGKPSRKSAGTFPFNPIPLSSPRLPLPAPQLCWPCLALVKNTNGCGMMGVPLFRVCRGLTVQMQSPAAGFPIRQTVRP